MLRATIIVYCAVLHVSHAFLTEKPDYIHTCFKNAPDFVNCSTNAVQQLFIHIPNGEPAIGLQPVDPLYIKKFDLLQGGSGPVSINASLTDGVITGFGKAQIISNTIDPKNFGFVTKLRLNSLRIEGHYNLNGRILVVPLSGDGDCWIDSKDLNIVAKTELTVIKHDDFNFFNVTGIHVKFDIGGLKLHLGNLFGGVPVLGKTTNAYLNQNWRAIVDSLSPLLIKTIGRLMLDILKPVFDNIPANFFIGDLER